MEIGSTITTSLVEMYSYTELSMYMRCPKRYEFSRLQNLEKIGISVPIDKGRWFHTLMQEDLLGNSWEDAHAALLEVFNREVVPFTLDEDILSIPSEVHRMFVGYKTKYPNDFASWKILQVEESMSFELFPGVHIGFTPDLVAEDEYGNVWAWDHKTTQTLPQVGEMLIDLQNLTYSIGLREKYGDRFKGFIFNYVRSKPPTEPKLRKDGLIADVRRVDTTYDMLVNFAVVNGILPYPELTDRLAYLSDHDAFFRRDYFIVPDAALENARKELTHWVAKLRADIELHNKGFESSFGRVILPSSAGTKACRKCPFYDVCQADFLGIPTEALLLDFQERTPLDREYNPIETEVQDGDNKTSQE